MKLLELSVTTGECGPVVMLSGEADLTTVGQLDDLLNAQISAGARLLRVDLSRLRFADSASIGVLVRAARVLKDQGGRLELVNPQPVVARTLSLLGVDRAVTIRGTTDAEPGSANGQGATGLLRPLEAHGTPPRGATWSRTR